MTYFKSQLPSQLEVAVQCKTHRVIVLVNYGSTLLLISIIDFQTIIILGSSNTLPKKDEECKYMDNHTFCATIAS